MIDNSREYILCAACWYENLSLKDNIKSNVRPINIDKGLVFCGHRHPHCIYSMVSITGLRQCEAGGEVQGFLTSENRFVDRHEAALIAYEAGQVNDRVTWNIERKDRWYLYSEDIY